jgi:hypothetical protein
VKEVTHLCSKSSLSTGATFEYIMVMILAWALHIHT